MNEGLDFNGRMTQLIAEITSHLDEFRDVDASRIRVSASFNRSRNRGGVLAYVVPLRYRDGVPVEMKRDGGKLYHWAMPPQEHEGREFLYYMYFMLPRFFGLSLRQKVETVVHELYHIDPTFNGDLRRFKGRSALHGNARAFDRKVTELTDQFLAITERPECYEFLRGGPYALRLRYGEILAQHYPEPKPKLLKVTPVDALANDLIFP